MTPRSLVRTLALIALACVAAPAYPATQLVLRRPGSAAAEVLPPGHGITWAGGPGGRLVTRTLDPAAPLRLLVALDAPPAALARLHGGDVAASTRVADRLRADLAALGRPGGAQVTRTFTQVWSGAAVTLAPELLERVRALPYVRGIYPDDSVHAVLDGSVPLIRADRVRTELGVDGTGIRIGIVDTGIDYTHPAFGVGFGPGHRVAGGYDFVNFDDDPMDDAGHGTHVAGIAAGNGGGVVGVAPGATLYAFKVLDSYGSGFESWILAGLDRVLDPDGNPATDDAMQVINLSLGGPGGPDDPLSLAIDHLSEAGVTCCIAAGNSGAFFGIGSPGCARSAITVGASTRVDTIAYFSSLGPVLETLDLKPDLVAPGEGIVSAARGGGRVAMSGTSMATPHVAGVAALLRQLHPAWTPEIVKSALISTAHDLSVSPFRQGAGRIDAWNAANATFAIGPTHLSFGRVDWDAPVWQQSQTLQVTNLTNAPRTVTLTDTLRLAFGAVLTTSPSHLDLAAGGSAPVLVTLEVDNAVTAAPHELPYGYAGMLIAVSAADSQRVPVSFHKTTELHVSSTGLIDWLIVHDRTTNGFVFSNQPVPTVFLPPGTYDVMASFYPRWRFVVRENVTVARQTTVEIDPDEAIRHLTFADAGPDGAPIDGSISSVRLTDQRSLWRFYYVGFPMDEMWVSDLSDAYRLEWVRSSSNFRNRRIDVPGAIQGLHADHEYGNAASDLRHVGFEFPHTLQPAVTLEWGYSDDPLLGGMVGFGGADPFGVATDSAFTYDYWFVPPVDQGLLAGFALDQYEWPDRALPLQSPVRLGPRIRLNRGSALPVHYLGFWTDPWLRFGGTRMTFGGLPVWRGRFHSVGGQGPTLDAGYDLNVPHLAADMYGALALEPDDPYTLSQGGVVVQSDTLRGSGQFSVFGTISTPVPARVPTEFHSWRDFEVGGAPARLDVRARMDLSQLDSEPPWLDRLELFANGEANDSIPVAAADAGLRCVVGDASPKSIQALIRPQGQSSWTPLTPESDSLEFLARFPSSLRGPVALRLVSTDDTGNQLELTWDPAFIATNVTTPPPGGGARLALAGARPNPAATAGFLAAFTLPSSAPARLTLHDVTGREILRREVGALGPGDHQLWLDPGRTLRPGLYFLRLTGSGADVRARVCLLR